MKWGRVGAVGIDPSAALLIEGQPFARGLSHWRELVGPHRASSVASDVPQGY